MKPRPQGDILIAALRNRWLTYAEMQRLYVSTCPWRRVMERLQHRPELELLKVRGEDGLIRWRVALASKRKAAQLQLNRARHGATGVTMNEQMPPAVAGQAEPTVRPRLWVVRVVREAYVLATDEDAALAQQREIERWEETPRVTAEPAEGQSTCMDGMTSRACASCMARTKTFHWQRHAACIPGPNVRANRRP